jgi:hypothetical protein
VKPVAHSRHWIVRRRRRLFVPSGHGGVRTLPENPDLGLNRRAARTTTEIKAVEKVKCNDHQSTPSAVLLWICTTFFFDRHTARFRVARPTLASEMAKLSADLCTRLTEKCHSSNKTAHAGSAPHYKTQRIIDGCFLCRCTVVTYLTRAEFWATCGRPSTESFATEWKWTTK